MSAQLSRYGLHVIISSYELMTAPRCCLNARCYRDFMWTLGAAGGSSGWIRFIRLCKCVTCAVLTMTQMVTNALLGAHPDSVVDRDNQSMTQR